MVVRTITEAGTQYTHLELGKDIPIGIAGYYTPYREVRLAFRGREVLYVVGKAVLESSCCGTGNWMYATVPGYILDWQTTSNDGLPATQVLPIGDENERDEVRKIIETRETVDLVLFW